MTYQAETVVVTIPVDASERKTTNADAIALSGFSFCFSCVTETVLALVKTGADMTTIAAEAVLASPAAITVANGLSGYC